MATAAKAPEDKAEFQVEQTLQKPLFKQILYWLVVVLTLGAFYLISHWFTWIEVAWRYSKAKLPTHLALKHKDGSLTVVELMLVNLPEGLVAKTSGTIAVFQFRMLRYTYDAPLNEFKQLQFNSALEYADVHAILGQGLQGPDVDERMKIFGPADLDVPVPSWSSLFFREVAHPFFVFQVFSVLVWILEDYILFALTILCLSLISLISNLIETRNNIKRIRGMAHYRCDIKVRRDGREVTIDSSGLVPGDLIEVPTNAKLPCDACLLTETCIVDESMLTGETVPVFKEPLPNSRGLRYSRETDKNHTLYGGTQALQAYNGTYAVVVATGFSTAKGSIVQSIMFPKPTKFKFYEDSLKFILVLGAIALVGYLCCLPIFIKEDIGTEFFILKALDLITITIPPTLPLAMTVGVSFAISRLKDKGVSCISPHAVNIAGKVTVMCFDKTGTLTESTMQLKGIEENAKLLNEKEEISESMSECLAACQSLTYLYGKLQGDSQELAIFERSGWTRAELEGHRTAYTKGERTLVQVTMFHFTSFLKRMGVIVQDLTTNDNVLYVKGAPEEVVKCCTDVPADFMNRVLGYSRRGLRVLACASKPIKIIPKDCNLIDIEDDMRLLGLIVLENKLKTETVETIEVLKTAGVRCIISTGDSALTGIAVAQNSGITPTDAEIFIGDAKSDRLTFENLNGLPVDWKFIESLPDYRLAITGPGLALALEPVQGNSEGPSLDVILEKGDVFGRMSPIHKASLVEALQSPTVTVGMCGDGANDCSALRAADVGVAVSEADASIAAPFSGRSLWCVVDVLKEGKCALSSSFQCFKFMALYSMIQFLSCFTLYQMQNSLADLQYLYIDLFTILPLAIFLSYTASYHLFTPDQLPNSLVSSHFLISIIGQILIQGVFIAASVGVLVSQPWYTHSTGHIVSPATSYENSTVFLVSIFQYVVVSFAFCTGAPFRQPCYRNYYYTASAVLLAGFDLYLLLVPDSFFLDHFQIKSLTLEFKLVLLSLIALNCVVTILFEAFTDNWANKQKPAASLPARKA